MKLHRLGLVWYSYSQFESTIQVSQSQQKVSKYFKAKQRLRDRVKAKNSKDGLTLGSTLAAICCMGLNLNPLTIGELS